MPSVMEPPVQTGEETKPEETLLGSAAPGMAMPLGFHLVSTTEPMVGYSLAVQAAVATQPSISQFGRGSLFDEQRRIP